MRDAAGCVYVYEQNTIIREAGRGGMDLNFKFLYNGLYILKLLALPLVPCLRLKTLELLHLPHLVLSFPLYCFTFIIF